MPRRKSDAPSPESVKALADSLSQNDQMRLFQLFLFDPASWVGRMIQANMDAMYKRSKYYEERAGLTPEQIDEQGLTTTVETGEKAVDRTGYKNPKVVKNIRCRIKKRLLEERPPPFSGPI
jgi:hypothetical protein